MCYRSFSSLKQDAKDFGDTESAYCNICVAHLLGRRDIVTKLPPVYPSYTMGEARAVLQRSIRAWEESETCSHLKKTLFSVLSRHSINKIVGFSCSSISSPQEDDRNLRHSIQHALLLTVRRLLERTRECTTEHKLPFYVQDPIYNDIEKEVL